VLTMRAALYSPDGAEMVEARARFARDSEQGPVELARELLERASQAISVHFSGEA